MGVRAAAARERKARSQVIRKLAECCLPARRCSAVGLERRHVAHRSVEAASLRPLRGHHVPRRRDVAAWRRRRCDAEEVLQEVLRSTLVVGRGSSRRHRYHQPVRQPALVVRCPKCCLHCFQRSLRCAHHQVRMAQCFTDMLHCVSQHARVARCS